MQTERAAAAGPSKLVSASNGTKGGERLSAADPRRCVHVIVAVTHDAARCRRLDLMSCSVSLQVMPRSAASSVSGDDMSTTVVTNSGV